MGKQSGEWEILRALDEGGQGWVFLVKDTNARNKEHQMYISEICFAKSPSSCLPP